MCLSDNKKVLEKTPLRICNTKMQYDGNLLTKSSQELN